MMVEWLTIGDARLTCGDCFDALPTMPLESIDVLITSPRYNVGIDYGAGCSDSTDWPTYYDEMHRLLVLSYSIMRDGGVLAINVPKDVRLHREEISVLNKRVEKISNRIDSLCAEVGFLPREAIVWVKGKEDTGPISTTFAMGSDNNIYIRPVCEMILLHSKGRYYYDNGTGRRGVKTVPFLEETKDVWWNVPARNNGHPTSFPIDIPSRLIKMFTCLKDGARVPVVLDPFMGSGTTGVAAIQLGRKFIGIEISPNYFQIAVKRITEAQQQLRLGLIGEW